MIKYRKKPIDVEVLQIFQKDIDVAFEIEKEKHQKDTEIKNLEYKAKGETRKIKSAGSLSGCTTLLFENIPIRLHHSFDKSNRERGWFVEAYIETLEGRMQISDGDWIIKGVHGEFYPCKPDIFQKTYEKII